MKFSVVTATFDSARTLERCLRSVAAQTQAHEHIVVDGGSSDGTLGMLKSSGIRFMSEPDKGVYDAFNKGLATASGDIVSFLGSDDEYLPGAFNSAATAFEENPGVLCVHGNIMVGEREVKPPRGFASLGGAKIFHPATFMRRELFDRIGNFDLQFKIASDLDLFLRARKSCEFIHIDRPLTRFSLGGMSTTKLFESAAEVRGILLKNGFHPLRAEFHWALLAARAAISKARRG